MRSKSIKISAILIALLMVVSLLPAAVFAAGIRTVNYKVESAGSPITKINRSNLVSIIVTVSDPAIALDPEAPADGQLHAYKLADSFTESASSAVSYEVKSATEYTVTFGGLIYSGEGQSFIFKVSEDSKATYTKQSLTIDEAIVYVAPPEPDDDYPAVPCNPPVVILGVASAPQIVKADDDFEVRFSVDNKSYKGLTDVYANLTASNGCRVDGYTTKVALSDIGSRKNTEFAVKFKAPGDLDTEYITLGVELQYTYYNDVQYTTGSSSETFYLDAQKLTQEGPSVVIPEPVVIVTGSVIDQIKEKTQFDYTVFFENKGKTALCNPVVKLTAGGELLLANESSTVILNDIPAGGTGSVTLKLKAPDTVSMPMQDVSVSMKYYYDSGSGTANTMGNVSESFSLSSVVSKQQEGPTVIGGPVPNVVITDFSFGGENVVAGQPFELEVKFRNTGKVAIENIVAVVDGGQNFTINGATNTIYYNSVGAGSTQTMTVPLMTLATASTGAQSISLSFQYEYVDHQVRSQNSSHVTLSVPITQLDRLEFDEPIMYDYVAYTGMETTVILNYVNKGKSEVSNVEVFVEGNVDALQQSQYLGNFPSGNSGNISFVLTAWEAGTADVTFVINYEDANGNAVTREIPYSFQVEDMNYGYDDPIYDDPVFDEPVEENGFFQTIPWWAWIIAAAVILAAVIIIVKSAKKKKAKKAVAAANEEFDVFGEE